MTILGLTGGIGSGKSAAAARLATKPGVRVVYADAEAKRLMHEDADLRAALTARFGPETYAPDGSLDRAALSRRVFGDTEELAALNALVHPAVREAMRAHIETAHQDGVTLLVYEAALLFEVGADAHVDTVVVVDAPVETRIARVMARDGTTEEAVRGRMAAQFPPETLRAKADYVIDNDGHLAHLYAQVDALYESLIR